MRDETNRDYSQPHNQLRPRSTASSGGELDEVCGGIEQSEAGKGLDRAIRQIDGKTKVKDTTEFASNTTNQGSKENGVPQMMSAAGSRLASKSAPRSALDRKIGGRC